MYKYELTYSVSVMHPDFKCLVDEQATQTFRADNDCEAKTKAKQLLKEDKRHKLGEYNTLHKIVRKEVR